MQLLMAQTRLPVEAVLLAAPTRMARQRAFVAVPELQPTEQMSAFPAESPGQPAIRKATFAQVRLAAFEPLMVKTWSAARAPFAASLTWTVRVVTWPAALVARPTEPTRLYNVELLQAFEINTATLAVRRSEELVQWMLMATLMVKSAVRNMRKGPTDILTPAVAYATGYNGIVTSRGQAVAVRNGFTGYTRYYGPGWYARYPGAWVAAGIAAAAWWTAPSYGYASGYTGCAEEPVSYQYGDDGIYAEDGNVYAGDEVIATEEEYYDQAAEIADDFDEQKTDDADWMPLGVFAVVSEGQTKSDMTLQLAINKEGMIRGNLSLDLTDEVIPVKGSLDKETQRVAFRLEGKPDIVVEADCTT